MKNDVIEVNTRAYAMLITKLINHLKYHPKMFCEMNGTRMSNATTQVVVSRFPFKMR